eukprot:2028683-Amphidinium_carterae.1
MVKTTLAAKKQQLSPMYNLLLNYRTSHARSRNCWNPNHNGFSPKARRTAAIENVDNYQF